MYGEYLSYLLILICKTNLIAFTCKFHSDLNSIMLNQGALHCIDTFGQQIPRAAKLRNLMTDGSTANICKFGSNLPVEAIPPPFQSFDGHS